MAFLRLSNTLRDSNGEQIRPTLDVPSPTETEHPIEEVESTTAPKDALVGSRRRTSSMVGGGTPLDLAPHIYAGSPPSK